jgi:hypothetical protein
MTPPRAAATKDSRFLFNAQMMQQFARHTAVFNRDYVGGV